MLKCNQKKIRFFMKDGKWVETTTTNDEKPREAFDRLLKVGLISNEKNLCYFTETTKVKRGV